MMMSAVKKKMGLVDEVVNEVGPETHKNWIDVSVLPVNSKANSKLIKGYAIRFKSQSKFGKDRIYFKSSDGLRLISRDCLKNGVSWSNCFFLPGSADKDDLPLTIYMKKNDGDRVLEAIREFNEKHKK